MGDRERRDAFLKGPFRRVRFVYLVAEWPQAAGMDLMDACEQAPPEALIAALTREVETYGAVIDEERRGRADAEAEVAALRAAYRLIGPQLGDGSVASEGRR